MARLDEYLDRLDGVAASALAAGATPDAAKWWDGYAEALTDMRKLARNQADMSEPLDEYLGKLRKLAEGALRSIDRHDEEEPKVDHSRQRAWWQGYRQCIDDVEDFNRKHPVITREDTA